MILKNYKIYNKGLIFKGAPHLEVKLTLKEQKELLKSKKAWFVRNLYNFDCKKTTSFWFVIKDSFGGMEELKPKIRNQVRRALKTLEIVPISKEKMLQSGYDVYLESFERYKDVTNPPVSKDIWLSWIKNGAENVEYWGALDKETGELVAYSENLIQDNACKYVALKAKPAYLKAHYPFYGMLYLMNEYYLDTKKMKYVTDGARTVTGHSNIQSFLDKFLFRKAYCEISITYVWWLHLLIRCIYPFRNFIPIKKLKYLINFEAMQRGDI